jgi:hypothetical protein
VRHGRRQRKNRDVEGKVGMDERGARTYCSAREEATTWETLSEKYLTFAFRLILLTRQALPYRM